MSYNGSGTFSINSAGQPTVAATLITATAHNALTADLATGLSTAITKDGQTTITANLPMGGFKHTGLGAGSAAGNSVRYEQAQLFDYATTATAAGTTTLTVASTRLQFFTGTTTQIVTLPVTSTLSAGHLFRIVNNSTGIVTVNSSGGNLVLAVGANSEALFTCILTTGTTAASWEFEAALQLSGGNMTGGFNEARANITQHATTMDLFAVAIPNILDGTGSAVTITAIVNAPQGGPTRTLYPVTGTTITNGATFAVDGAADYTTAAGDALEFEAVTTSTYKVHITKKDGTSVAAFAATQAEQEAGTSVLTAVTPGRQQFHPSAAKGWCRFTPSGAVVLGHNVTSVTDSGGGRILITWNVDFSTASHCAVGAPHMTAFNGLFRMDEITAGTTGVQVVNISATGTDPISYAVSAFGDQ